MSDRARRSTQQPKSYKDFNKKSHDTIPDHSTLDQHELMRQQSTEKGRSSSDDHSEVILNAQTCSRWKSARSMNTKSSKKADASSVDSGSDGQAQTTSEACWMGHEEIMTLQQDTDFESSEMGVALHIESGDDDLDNDTGKKLIRTTKRSAVKTPQNKNHTFLSTKSLVDTAKSHSPSKKSRAKMTVAK